MYSSAFVFSPGYRQIERKYGSVPQLTHHADRPAMRFDNGFRDRQAHARSLHAVALIRPAVELVENKAQFGVTNPRPPVRNTEEYAIFLLFRADRDRLVRRGIQIRILNQMDEHFPGARQVRADARLRILDLQSNGPGAQSTLARLKRRGNQFVDTMRL